LCDSLLNAACISLSDIDGFAVSNGPGSFTGLRIGISAIKGMAQGLNRPCIGVSTLEALAYNYRGLFGTICAVMDARCNQVYTATFQINGGDPERLTEDTAISIEALSAQLAERKTPIIFVGDGAFLCYNTLKENLSDIWLAPPQLRLQDAASVGFVANRLIKEGNSLLSASELMPKYLRLPQAERELLKKTASDIHHNQSTRRNSDDSTGK
ncbi:MAG: tRNA (adenosine(37)-N6)-threonylcarbamoyltransferase complex dimerization subunit type 1 TsaB, partial [Oscillospiraceae bacterium]